MRPAGARSVASTNGSSRPATSTRWSASCTTTDALVVLGGDGTFLRAVRAVAEVDVPILGINLGKVGFLSKAEARRARSMSWPRSSPVEFTIDERMALEAQILRGGKPIHERPPFRAQRRRRSPAARSPVSCRLDVAIDDTHLATFVADGLVVSSPTGSTG